MTKRVARFTVLPELLAQAMNMPKDCTIMEVVRDKKYLAGAFEFIVEHDSLPEVEEGAEIPKTMPMITTHNHKTEGGYFVDTYEWDWGIDE